MKYHKKLGLISMSLFIIALNAYAGMVAGDQKYLRGFKEISKYKLSLSLQHLKLRNTKEAILARRNRRLPDLPQLNSLEEDLQIKVQELQSRIKSLEEKLNDKRADESLAAINQRNLALAMAGHTNIYAFKGHYKVMVIPVQFSDTKLSSPEFFSPNSHGVIPAQDYLFGSGPDTLSTFYKHESLGHFILSGEVTPIVTVDKTQEYYGEAISNSSDAHARELVVDALSVLKEQIKDKDWWDSFDSWDLSDYDKDNNFHEPDGFVDAVVFVYAGKSQASCQASFDTDGTRPASHEVPAGPRHDAAVECFNRLWPHRWSISLSSEDPRYTELGPIVEGNQRPSMNGLKIHEGLFALDYNMQSEYSDRSTFMHEFGHSLSLPDVYSQGPKDNSTGEWELMSHNAHDVGQEFSSYSKISLGWLFPKVIVEGEKTSAYLGAYNFVSKKQRENHSRYKGPEVSTEILDGKTFDFSIVSKVPEYDESVYRSLAILPKPEAAVQTVITPPESVGNYTAYSGLFDGAIRKMKFKLKVPETGDMNLSFDTYYAIETETNFDSTDPSDSEVKVTIDYDIGRVLINNELFEELRTISGDNNFDTLAEANPSCQYQRVLEIRSKKIQGSASEEEINEMNKLLTDCRSPQWVKKTYDLKKFAGQTIELEIQLQTDAGYNEKGLLVDNIQLGDEKIDFESGDEYLAQDFLLLKDGVYEKIYHQFYLMEYRTPGEKFVSGKSKQELSLNMDNHIVEGTQSFFSGNGTTKDRFRLVTFAYRPGVLVWYYNAKYGRTKNDPASQKGKGYLLVLNSKVQELKLPSILGQSDLINEQGQYRRTEDVYKNFVKEQRNEFMCFSAIDYFTYLNGEAPDCQNRSDLDHMPKLTLDGKKLLYRRYDFNEILPQNRHLNFEVGEPMRNGAFMRTGLSTFVPTGSKAFAPFRVYKIENEKLVLDEELTKEAPVYEGVSEFSDSDNSFSEFSEFQGDTVVVEKRGLKFHVERPSSRILSLYNTRASADSSVQRLRAPRAKIYIDWE